MAMSDRPGDGVEPSTTYLQDISSVEGVNEATQRFNTYLNELRKRGESNVRVVVLGVDDDR